MPKKTKTVKAYAVDGEYLKLFRGPMSFIWFKKSDAERHVGCQNGEARIVPVTITYKV